MLSKSSGTQGARSKAERREGPLWVWMQDRGGTGVGRKASFLLLFLSKTKDHQLRARKGHLSSRGARWETFRVPRVLPSPVTNVLRNYQCDCQMTVSSATP